jgi:hypothetical protein
MCPEKLLAMRLSRRDGNQYPADILAVVELLRNPQFPRIERILVRRLFLRFSVAGRMGVFDHQPCLLTLMKLLCRRAAWLCELCEESDDAGQQFSRICQ